MQVLAHPAHQTTLYRNGPHLYFFAEPSQNKTHFDVLSDLLGRPFDAVPFAGHPLLDLFLDALQERSAGIWQLQASDLHLTQIELPVQVETRRQIDLDTPQLEHSSLACRTRQLDPSMVKGLLRAERWPVQVMPVCAVPVRLLGQPDFGIGRSSVARNAEVGALLEALERLSAVDQGQHQIITSRPAELAGRKIAPSDLVALDHHAEPDGPIDWTAGWSLRHQEQVFLPAREVFMGYSRDEGALNVSSSGCALGSSLEEALLHALFELIERDAFLLRWYSQTSVPMLDLSLIPEGEIQGLLLAAEHMGYQVQVFDVTTENQVPAVWAMAKGQTPEQIHSFSSLGAHMDPIRALKGALQELLVSLELYVPSFDEKRAKMLLDQPEQVQDGNDHFQFYAHKDSHKHLDFLSETPDAKATLQFLERQHFWSDQDLVVKLRKWIGILLHHHPDVTFVDLTPPGLRALGLHAVRAVVPDLLPMTFGHQGRRTRNCQRLQNALQKNQTSLPDAPHPFP